jgi:uncharacterized protein with von Willebrand factor type A (vWA) domain
VLTCFWTVKILERQLEDERKRSVTAVAEIKRLQKDLETAKGQLDAERRRGAAASSPAGAAGKEEPRSRAGTVVDTQALYEKIRTLELKKEKEVCTITHHTPPHTIAHTAHAQPAHVRRTALFLKHV